MARKKREEEQPDTGGWINTFADLMNLLLCFFVLLFSMSTVDAEKYEQIVTSLTNKINIFDAGGKSISESGPLMQTGSNQVVSLSQYFNEFEKTGDSDSKEDDSSGSTSEQDTPEVTPADEKKVEKKQEEKRREEAEEIYNSMSESAQKGNIEDQITINMDKSYQYVQISLNGAILFDSGTAELKKSALSLLSKVGDILKLYDKHMIKIEGHTDNVPISSGAYPSNMWLSSARAIEVFEYLVNKKHLDEGSLEATGRGEYDPVATNKTAKGRAKNRRVELKIYTDTKTGQKTNKKSSKK